jgi:hypothetical protein
MLEGGESLPQPVQPLTEAQTPAPSVAASEQSAPRDRFDFVKRMVQGRRNQRTGPKLNK